MDASIGIRDARDETSYRKPRIMLKETNYKVWSTVVEQTLHEKKPWQLVVGTAFKPPAARVVMPFTAVVVAIPRVNDVVGVAEIIEEMVDQHVRKLEDFNAAIARANTVLLQTLEAKDVMATMMLLPPKEKWNELGADDAAVLASIAAIARPRFHDSRMRDGDTVVQTQHMFD